MIGSLDSFRPVLCSINLISVTLTDLWRHECYISHITPVMSNVWTTLWTAQVPVELVEGSVFPKQSGCISLYFFQFMLDVVIITLWSLILTTYGPWIISLLSSLGSLSQKRSHYIMSREREDQLFIIISCIIYMCTFLHSAVRSQQWTG